jgi:hypothetical protein
MYHPFVFVNIIYAKLHNRFINYNQYLPTAIVWFEVQIAAKVIWIIEMGIIGELGVPGALAHKE